jgi:fibronectin-binding autotransporter adhesin
MDKTVVVTNRMKNSLRIVYSMALAVLCLLVSSLRSEAATSLLDQNGSAAGFWDGTTLFITADMAANTPGTTNWTTSLTGTTTTVTNPVGNSIQIGGSNPDFNGATIIVTNTINGSATANPAFFTVVATNATVDWLIPLTGVNARYTHAFTWAVTNGSTLNHGGANFNWNNQACTLVGNGTMCFSNVLGNNETTSGITNNMIGGKLLLAQTSIGTFGNATTGHGFTLANGTVVFLSPQSLADTFGSFLAGTDVTLKINGGAMDNQSGAPGTVSVGAGAFSFGGSGTFTYVGSATDMSLGPSAVTLNLTPQITVLANTFSIGGVISSGGGFGITKLGNGTLNLTNANTYTGPTTVSAGTLIAPTIATGAGSYTAGDGATLGVKVSAVGQSLNMSSLTVGSATGATLQFDVGPVSNPTTAPIHVSGALTINGAANPISFSTIAPIPSYPTVIPLISYGSIVGNPATFSMGSFPAASPAYQGYISNDVSGQLIDLVLTNGMVTTPVGSPKPVTWQGTPTGNWDTTTKNWLNSGIATNYADVTTSGTGDPATFDDSLTGTSTVNLTTNLSPVSITMANVNSNYVFTGTGRITSVASLTLNGTGTLTLDNSGNNDFSGGVTINSGTLQIGNNDANGRPGTAGIVDNGAIVFNRSDAVLGSTVAMGVISGSGSITNIGSGTVTLSGVQTLTGSAVVNAGILALSGPNTAISALSSITNLTINNGGTVQFLTDNAMGTASPGVPITVNAGGVLTGISTSSHLPGQLTLNGGTLTMGGSQISTVNGTWELEGGLVVPGSPTTSTISTLSVVPHQTGGTVFNITNGATSGIDLLVSGTFINASGSGAHDTGIIKNGPGTMVLDNNNSYTNTTTVAGGVLQLGLPSDAAVLTSPLGFNPLVTITTGGVLSFGSSQGMVITNSIADDGTGIVLSKAGSNVLSGANTFTGSTIVASGSILKLANRSTFSSSTVNVSNATFDVSSGSAINVAGTWAFTNSSFNMGTNLITVGGLNVSNTTLTFPVNPLLLPINVSGALATGGSTNVINVTAMPGFGSYPTNITLIKYGSFANVDGQNRLTTLGVVFSALGSPVGYLTNNVANNSIDLVVVSDLLQPIQPISWNGQTNGINVSTWDIINTADWLLSADGTTVYRYQDGSAVTFDDTAHGSTSVLLSNTVTPLSLTVSNAAKTYTFGGSGSITGPIALYKTNSGTATFTESGGDTFSQGIVMGGGTLVYAATNANISGGLNVSSGLAIMDYTGKFTGNTVIASGSTVQVGNNDGQGNLPSSSIDVEGGLLFNRSDAALTVSNIISGAGGVTNNGTGTVTLTATNSFTGPTVANAGTLQLGGGNTAVSGLHSSSQLLINNGATVEVLVDNALAGHGTLGVLPITINAGGVLTGSPGADAGNGTSTHIQGLLTLNGGTLANSGTSSNVVNGSWDLDDGVATTGGSATSTISAFCVVPTQGGFNVVAGTTPSGIDLDITGTLINGTSQHDGGVTLSGGGVMRMSNTNNYAGATAINNGVLVVNAIETPGVAGPLGKSGAINFGGGTLRYSANNTFDYSSRFGAGGQYNIDTAGQNVAFATALSSGSLTKLGNGTLTLGAANTYNGDTTVGRGKLVTSTASTGAGNYIVTNSGTLDVQVAAAGAQLAVNNLTLGGTASDVSTLQIDTGATGNPTAAAVTSAGAFGTNGTVNVALTGTALTPGTFPLIAYTGASAGSLLHFIPPAGLGGSLSDNGTGLISVTLTAGGPSTNANITRVSLSGTNMVIHGTNNNVPNTSFHYVVLASPSLTNALTNWTPIVTNTFNPDGTFDYTNPIVPGTPRQFIDVEAAP